MSVRRAREAWSIRPASAAAAASRSTQRAPGRAGDDGSEGSDWCDDCGVRVRDVDDEEFDRDAEETPARPDCGNAMRFERTTGSDCAC